MGQSFSVMEWMGTSALAVAVAIANQGSFAIFLEYLGYDNQDPSEVRAREDLRLVMLVVMGVTVLFGLLSHIERVRQESYQAGVNAERVRRHREEDVKESSG